MAQNTRRHPSWLKVRVVSGPNFAEVKGLVQTHRLHTVCQEARCPNVWDCWERRTATFMLLGDTCTRRCGFCAVKTGRPADLDWREPERVARAVQVLGLKHAVITSVNRDDIEHGGAPIFAETIRRIRRTTPNCTVEVLIPDFKGSKTALMAVLEANPDILNHNTETVPRLYPLARPQAKYERTLELLRRAKDYGAVTKSGIMVGIGERRDEISQVMRDLRGVECDILTVGQYLQPTKQHLPIHCYYTPEAFAAIKTEGLTLGFSHVEAGSLVRSSYRARDQLEIARKQSTINNFQLALPNPLFYSGNNH